MSAVYFAGVMIRLMLTLTPVVCILSAIAFSKTFEVYLKDDMKKSSSIESKEISNEKLYDKVSIFLCYCIQQHITGCFMLLVDNICYAIVL